MTALTIGSHVAVHKLMQKLYPEWDSSKAEFYEVYTYEKVEDVVNFATVSEVEFHFTGDENPSLVTFQKFWENFSVLEPEAIKTYIVDVMPATILDEWKVAFENGQELYTVRHQQPVESMTQSEVEALKDPKANLQ